jgi:hypothetical protein
MDIQLSSGEIFRQFPSDVAHAFCALGLAKPLQVALKEAREHNEVSEPLPSVPTFSVVRSSTTEHINIVLKKPSGETSVFDGYGYASDRQVMEGLARDAFKSFAWDAGAQKRTLQGIEVPAEIVAKYCDEYFGDLNERVKQRREAENQGYFAGAYQGRG